MNDPQALTLALLGTVLVASLLGSLHCAGMCGGLVLFVVGADNTPAKSVKLQTAYHAGRGAAYTTLGALAGLLGGALDNAGSLVGMQQAAAIGAGSLMIVFGLAALARSCGMRVSKGRVPKRVRNVIEGSHRAAMGLTPVRRALAVGVLTPLLPCGWLYAFVAVAAGTASLFGGGLVMAGFWLGTLPVLAGLGVGLRALTGPLRSRVPVVSSLIVVGFGVMTAMGRLGVPLEQPAPIEGTLAERVEAVSELDHADLPCCGVPGDALSGAPSEHAESEGHD